MMVVVVVVMLREEGMRFGFVGWAALVLKRGFGMGGISLCK